ncbi:50S ribosomal protein [Parasponia andersonii]|uniref:50S ribosomal protein n=1 Tax=Parasponia andersonii TaxID=3476 RepID=A0A2P5E564_PARAD|nr:50S ribosomal protein [Parasponia andersonii]
MALVVCSTSLRSSLLSSASYASSFSFSSPSSSATTIPSIFRLQIKSIDLHSKSFYGVRIQMPLVVNRAVSVVVKASSETDGAGPTESIEAQVSESKEEQVSVDKLPLESKLKERMEQKLRMKLAKKIRLRRKRLVRKRRMRKKGRWPPSKMKKLKNV